MIMWKVIYNVCGYYVFMYQVRAQQLQVVNPVGGSRPAQPPQFINSQVFVRTPNAIQVTK